MNSGENRHIFSGVISVTSWGREGEEISDWDSKFLPLKIKKKFQILLGGEVFFRAIPKTNTAHERYIQDIHEMKSCDRKF